ncbi:MAG: hypothetical protein GDA40_03095 [Rhodobacteraceae bacterium]|nr:hypothetical protein [Paracoccaceae bacterium]
MLGAAVFRLVENLVDPYCRYSQNHKPPKRLWPFMLEYARPFRRVFWFAGGVSVVAAVIAAPRNRALWGVVGRCLCPVANVQQFQGHLA